MNRIVILLLLSVCSAGLYGADESGACPVMETGGQPMPNEWIDRDTGHRIVKLTRRAGSNASFYFHNNPFIGNEMVFRGSDVAHAGNDMVHGGGPQRRTQMYAVDLKTLAIRQLTNEPFNVSTEIVCAKTHELFYQHGDTVYAMNTDNLRRRTVAVMPQQLRGGIVTVNADGTLLAGKLDDPEERKILREHPKKSEFFNLIFQARLKKTIFTIDTRTGVMDTIYSERAWLNHLQFSPTDPMLLMFCHEGPWHEVDRIWTIDVVKRQKPRLIHKRTIYREIAGHEWWGADGRHIYFDLQKPRGETFFVGKTNVYTGQEEDYELQRREWSVHFVSSWDEKTLAGDGGSKTSVAHSPEGQWLYHFEYDGGRLRSTRLVNMKNHNYNLEPNIHFSPDQQWIIFRANYEGVENVYAVSIAKELQEPLAFPTAEGYGKYTVGGRGGRVYEVTTLADGGEGSLRAAVEAEGPRTVVFRVSGTISLKRQLRIRHPYITIAGQTAPGDGICLRGYPLSIDADHVVVRYLRVRLGDETKTESDAISARGHKHIILDHVSASWSVDETMSVYHCDSITVQWCLVSESLFGSHHLKGAHGFGGIWGGNYSTYHHNLLACHSSRNPRFAGGSGFVDFRNNVVYNWGYNSTYGGGALHKEGRDPRFLVRHTDVNMVGNYYKPGPATMPGEVSHRIANPSWANGDCGKWYVSGNVMEGHAAVTADNWKGGIQPNSPLPQVMDSIRRSAPWPAMPIAEESAAQALASVLEHVGASYPRRDRADQRVIDDVRTGRATAEGPAYKASHAMADKQVKSGIIDSQADVGGWPELKSSEPPVDTDHDGMPDEWERRHGLNPADAADGAHPVPGSHYTQLEVYLSSLVDGF